MEVTFKDEKLQYDISKKAAKVSALSSGKIDKYECHIGEEILRSNQRQIIEQAKFTYFPLGKALEKQTGKQVGALKFLDLSKKKKDELKQTEGIFPLNLMNDLGRAKLKEVINLQDIIKPDALHYKLKRRKVCNFSKYSLPIAF